MSNRRNHRHPPGGTHKPSPPAKPIPESPAPNADQGAAETKTDKKPPKPDFDQSMVRWTRIVGFFTAVLAVVGALQFWAFVQSERAFLSIISMSINGGLPKAGENSFLLFAQLKNSGRSTAFIDYAEFATKFGDLPATPQYGDEHQIAEPPLAADSIANDTDNIILNPRALTQEEITGISSGSIRMSIYGYYVYTDAYSLFGNRTYGFCYMLTNQPTGASNFIGCPERAYTYVR